MMRLILVVCCVRGVRSYAAALMCCGGGGFVDRAVVTTLAGSGAASFADGSGSNVRFFNPRSVAVDASGNVFVADRDNQRIRKVTAGGGTRIGPVTLHARVADGQSCRSAGVKRP